MYNIDFKKIMPYVIDSYKEVYGEEYGFIIEERLNNAYIFLYNDVEGLRDYLRHITMCKRREYIIKFLNNILVDTKNYKEDNYAEDLTDEIKKSFDKFILNKDNNNYITFKAFDEKTNKNDEIVILCMLKFINSYLGYNVTKETLPDFMKKDEYKKVLQEVNRLVNIFDPLYNEYIEYIEKLSPYYDYVEKEEQRKNDIFISKRLTTLKEVDNLLPNSVLKIIENKSDNDKCDILFGNTEYCIIDSFSNNNLNRLKNSSVDLSERYTIIRYQLQYLENMGIHISLFDFLNDEKEDNIDKYLEYLNDDSIKQYIPDNFAISNITFIYKHNINAGIREYYSNKEDFKNILLTVGESNYDFIYDIFKEGRVCIVGKGAIVNEEKFVSVMFYTIREYDYGILNNNFVHECGHIISQTENGIGFENINTFEMHRLNPYNNKCRIYEKFNETINDIFTFEVIKSLYNKDLFLIEPKEFSVLNDLILNNINTCDITKKLLYPLVTTYRKEIIESLIHSDADILKKVIGANNFENIVDAVNKLDYLTRTGLLDNLDDKDNEITKEYYRVVEKVKKIYNDINCSESKTNNTLVKKI